MSKMDTSVQLVCYPMEFGRIVRAMQADGGSAVVEPKLVHGELYYACGVIPCSVFDVDGVRIAVAGLRLVEDAEQHTLDYASIKAN